MELSFRALRIVGGVEVAAPYNTALNNDLSNGEYVVDISTAPNIMQIKRLISFPHFPQVFPQVCRKVAQTFPQNRDKISKKSQKRAAAFGIWVYRMWKIRIGPARKKSGDAGHLSAIDGQSPFAVRRPAAIPIAAAAARPPGIPPDSTM